MFAKLFNIASSQAGGFLASCYAYGFSKALFMAPFHIIRNLVRKEMLEPKPILPMKPVKEIVENIANDFQIMMVANYAMDNLKLLAKANSLASPILMAAMRSALTSTLYQYNQTEAFNYQELLQDFINGAARCYFIGTIIDLMMEASGHELKKSVPLPVLVAAGVMGECMLHYYKQSYKIDENKIRERGPRHLPLATIKI